MGLYCNYLHYSVDIIIMIKTGRANTAITRNTKSPTPQLHFDASQSFKKYRNQQYLTPRQQCHSAQGYRSEHHSQKKQNVTARSQTKIQSKVPIMTSTSKQEELKKRINKLGLQSFMKQIVLSDKISDPQFSSRVIYALNKTYIMNELDAPKCEMPSSFGKKTLLRQSRRLQNNLRVQWNPEKQLIEQQFRDSSLFIPNSMFPRRQNQATKLIKNRQKRNIELYKKNPLLGYKTQKSRGSSLSNNINLDENLKSFHLLNRSMSERKRKNQIGVQKYDKIKNNQSLIFGRKARIYI